MAAPTDPTGTEMSARIETLERRLAEAERRLPDSKIVSGDFLTRTFAVWGHYFVANLLIGLAFLFVFGGSFMLLAMAGLIGRF